MAPDLTVHTYRGTEAQPFFSDLARLRIEIFREYPYLYEGDLAYETEYAASYRDCPDSLLVVAQDRGKVVGISTAFPLVSAMSQSMKLESAFVSHHRPMSDYFYLGESILLPAYRGSGVYKEFFRYREAAAREHGSSHALFFAIERPDSHPAKPPQYQSLEPVWHRFQYQKIPDVIARFSWKEVGIPTLIENTMTAWVKEL